MEGNASKEAGCGKNIRRPERYVANQSERVRGETKPGGRASSLIVVGRLKQQQQPHGKCGCLRFSGRRTRTQRGRGGRELPGGIILRRKDVWSASRNLRVPTIIAERASLRFVEADQIATPRRAGSEITRAEMRDAFKVSQFLPASKTPVYK